MAPINATIITHIYKSNIAGTNLVPLNLFSQILHQGNGIDLWYLIVSLAPMDLLTHWMGKC